MLYLIPFAEKSFRYFLLIRIISGKIFAVYFINKEADEASEKDA